MKKICSILYVFVFLFVVSCADSVSKKSEKSSDADLIELSDSDSEGDVEKSEGDTASDTDTEASDKGVKEDDDTETADVEVSDEESDFEIESDADVTDQEDDSETGEESDDADVDGQLETHDDTGNGGEEPMEFDLEGCGSVTHIKDISLLLIPGTIDHVYYSLFSPEVGIQKLQDENDPDYYYFEDFFYMDFNMADDVEYGKTGKFALGEGAYSSFQTAPQRVYLDVDSEHLEGGDTAYFAKSGVLELKKVDLDVDGYVTGSAGSITGLVLKEHFFEDYMSSAFVEDGGCFVVDQKIEWDLKVED